METKRDGVHLQFYADGSGPSFCFTPQNVTYCGVNERLSVGSRGMW